MISLTTFQLSNQVGFYVQSVPRNWKTPIVLINCFVGDNDFVRGTDLVDTCWLVSLSAS